MISVKFIYRVYLGNMGTVDSIKPSNNRASSLHKKQSTYRFHNYLSGHKHIEGAYAFNVGAGRAFQR